MSDANDLTASPEQFNEDKFSVVDNVRIHPSRMVFYNAYEGKRFEKKLVFQNCGNNLAFIRLCEPSSITFQYAAFPKGLYLSPGMSITRKVSYTYQAAIGTIQAHCSIFVNNQEFIYQFVVILTNQILTVEPQELNFGRIDATNRAAIQTFQIKNVGFKGAQFAIDLGKNHSDLWVQPMKGTVPAKSSVTITVEIVGTNTGEFMEEIWVKADPLQRVVITGCFIEPHIRIKDVVGNLDFTFYEFRPTYVGSTFTRALNINNYSSFDGMFCVMAVVNGIVMPIEEAKQIDNNYCNFIIKPTDGRVAALKESIIQLTFAPIKLPPVYSACFYRVIRIDCRDVGKEFSYTSDKIPTTTKEYEQRVIESSQQYSFPFHAEESMRNILFENKAKNIENLSFESSLSFCLYGKKQIPNISLQPTEFFLSDLVLNQQYNRELLVVNNSDVLPVMLKYRKTASIDVEPAEFTLYPKRSLELLIVMRKLRLDATIKKIVFELFSCDNKPHKIGSVCVNVHLDSCIVLPKTKRDQKCLCKPVPVHLEDDLPFQLSYEEKLKKDQNRNYYRMYLKKFWKKNDANTEVEAKRLVCMNLKNEKPLEKLKMDASSFIPLDPKYLYNIKIAPKALRLQNIAAYTTITDFFVIKNFNSFPVRICTKASKSCIFFEQSNHLIGSGQSKKISFVFSTTHIGKYYVNIFVLVNDSTLYEVTTVADVVPKTIKTETCQVLITQIYGEYALFKLTNGLNALTCFSWDIPVGSYEIYPLTGTIKGKTQMLCTVTYKPGLEKPQTLECFLTSESGHKKVVAISYEKRVHKVLFETFTLDVGSIPLNLPIKKTLILKNTRNFQTVFEIVNPNPIPGVRIQPEKGILPGMDSQIITVFILLKEFIEFSTSIIFCINYDEQIPVTLNGMVEFPTVYLEPNRLQFRQIAPFAYDTLAFKMKNVSRCRSVINFQMDDYPEFVITESEEDKTLAVQQITLQPQDCKILYLHFCPSYVCTFSLVLPYVINGILGPICANVGETSNPESYFEKAAYKEVKDVKFLPLPKKLNKIKIQACCGHQIVSFSDLTPNFVYFCDGHYNNVLEKDLEICNTSDKRVELCIRTDNLAPPFSFTPTNYKQIEIYSVSYKLAMEPNETVKFSIKFSPSSYGKYVVKLPIFLRRFCDETMFNYLCLNGSYSIPQIIPGIQRCDFIPILCKAITKKSFTLRFLNHFEHCRIWANSETKHFNIEISHEPEFDQGDFKVFVTVTVHSETPICVDTEIQFQCTCNGNCVIPVTAVVNVCDLTCYAYEHIYQLQIASADVETRTLNVSDNRSWYSWTCTKKIIDILAAAPFPLFPVDEDDSDYAAYMRRLVKTVENWVFSQGFFMKYRCKIPEGFTTFCKAFKQKGKFGTSNKSNKTPMAELMVNFTGLKAFCIDFPDSDDSNVWLSYIYKMNFQILEYFRKIESCLPHIKPEYLLNYEQYSKFKRFKKSYNVMEEERFYRLSKQCWLDLLIHAIKTFYFDRSFGPLEEPPMKPTVPKIQRRQTISFPAGEQATNVVYIGHTRKLVNWLLHCYESQIPVLYKDKSPLLKNNLLLERDLQDGIILGAVTTFYCPYVQQKIGEMFLSPDNEEEIHHNVCILISTWKLLNLNYLIHPSSLMKPNLMETLLLVTYLYNVLPNFTPTEVIRIEAPLTQVASASIEIENLGTTAIHYRVSFFNDEYRLFSVANSTIVLSAGSRKNIEIEYHAKFLNSVSSTVLFSGETPGQKYGKSFAVTVEGTARIYASMEIPLKLVLYKPCKVSLDLEAPFKMQAMYTLHFGYDPSPLNTNTKDSLYPWYDLKKVKNLKHIWFYDDVYAFDEEGKCKLDFVLCCEQLAEKDLWFCFHNEEIGSWTVKVTVTGRFNNDCYDDLKVEVPENYNEIMCRCKGKKSVEKQCPKILNVKVPMTNNKLLQAQKKMLLEMLQGEEYDFWSKRIFEESGTRILRLVVYSEDHPTRHRIEQNLTFVVEADSKRIATKREILITDTWAEGYYNLPIHPLQEIEKLEKTVLKLQEKDAEIWTRFHRLYFIRKTNKV